MTDIRHRPNRPSRVSGKLLLGSRDVVQSPLLSAGEHHDRKVMHWYRLCTIVDALLHRATASRSEGTTMAAINTIAEKQERLDG